MDFIDQHQQTGTVSVPKMVGMLNKAQGLNGFKPAEVGTPVFDAGDKYFLMFESLDGKRNVEVSYYKDTLGPVIDFKKDKLDFLTTQAQELGLGY